LAYYEIYARHGVEFASNDIQNYFENQDWYFGFVSEDDFEEVLTKVERKNLKFLKKMEKKKEKQNKINKEE
jgi:hypothetical protein